VVYKRSKGVQFARLQKLSHRAENRQEPECPHFEQCPGCQFLHTDYASELGFKRAALLRHLGQLEGAEGAIEVLPAPRRLGYRKRVQLHYRHKHIGVLDAVSDKVVAIPHCKIMREEIKPAFDSLYEESQWSKEHPGRGHCELYLQGEEVGIQWNQEYAHGGFSQVYDEMNQLLQQRVQTILSDLAPAKLLDLFSGQGNLTHSYAVAGGERVLVDSYYSDAQLPDNFCKLDLYDEESLAQFVRQHGKGDFDTFVIDPPRRGFPELDRWVRKFKPRHLLYVSCGPASLARDLRNLSKPYRLHQLDLLDLFPATSHFETLVLLEFV